jgi:hypothetical protein
MASLSSERRAADVDLDRQVRRGIGRGVELNAAALPLLVLDREGRIGLETALKVCPPPSHRSDVPDRDGERAGHRLDQQRERAVGLFVLGGGGTISSMPRS